MMLWIVAFVIAAAVKLGRTSDPCYDHQKLNYTAQFQPSECVAACTVTPFFSPDTSVDAYITLIESATTSIDIFTPDFDSWSSCTEVSTSCGGKCIGCNLPDQRNETFPVFTALLNAVHERKVAIRLLTNDFSVTTCPGMITPLDWLTLNGIQIGLYTTTTFLHAKFMMIDRGKRTLVSSVNFSKTSFTKNREAGVIMDNCSCSAITFYQDVFEYDWSQSLPYVIDTTYNSSQLAYIKNSSILPYAIPSYHTVKGAYVAPFTSYNGVTIKLAYTAPDYAYDTVMKGLSETSSSLQVMIYEITSTAMCNMTLELFKAGKNVTLLVSSNIVNYEELILARVCYNMLYNNGLKGHIRKTNSGFEFSHQKFWIIDNTAVHLSTGNWSPDDFPVGNFFPPYKKSDVSTFRDMLVVMESPDIVHAFQTVFDRDWAIGTDWVPTP